MVYEEGDNSSERSFLIDFEILNSPHRIESAALRSHGSVAMV